MLLGLVLLGGCSSAKSSGGTVATSAAVEVAESATSEPAALLLADIGDESACGSPAAAFIGISDLDDSTALAIEVHQNSPDTVLDVELPDPRVTVQVQTGRSLGDPFCNDLVGPRYMVETTQTATEGRIQLTFVDDSIGVLIEGLQTAPHPVAAINPQLMVDVPIGPGGG